MSKFVQSKRSELNKYMSTSHMNMMYSYAISNPFRRQNVFPGIWSILLLKDDSNNNNNNNNYINNNNNNNNNNNFLYFIILILKIIYILLLNLKNAY